MITFYITIAHYLNSRIDISIGASQIAQIVKESAYNAGDLGLTPGSGRSPRDFLPGESHGQRSLVG